MPCIHPPAAAAHLQLQHLGQEFGQQLGLLAHQQLQQRVQVIHLGKVGLAAQSVCWNSPGWEACGTFTLQAVVL